MIETTTRYPDPASYPQTPNGVYRWLRDLLADPERLATDAFARDAGGVMVDADSPVASSWCLRGALWLAGTLFETVPYETLAMGIWDAIDRRHPERLGMTELNDGPNGHRRVLTLLDDAIEASA